MSTAIPNLFTILFVSLTKAVEDGNYSVFL